MIKMLKWWAVRGAIALVAVAGSGMVVLAYNDNDNSDDSVSTPALDGFEGRAADEDVKVQM